MENPTTPPKFFFTARFDFSMHAYVHACRFQAPQAAPARSPAQAGFTQAHWELGIG